MKKYFYLIFFTIILYFVGMQKTKWDYYKTINNNVKFITYSIEVNKKFTNLSALEKIFTILHRKMTDFVYGIVLDTNNKPLLIGNIADKEIRTKVVNNKKIRFILKDINLHPQKYYNSHKPIIVHLDKKDFVLFRFQKFQKFNLVLAFLNTDLRIRKQEWLIGIGLFFLFFFILFITLKRKKPKHQKKRKPKKTKNSKQTSSFSQQNIQVLYEDKKNLRKEIDKLSFFREITLATNSMDNFNEMLQSILRVLSIKFEQANIILYVGEEDTNFKEFYPKYGWFYASQKILNQKELMHAGITAYDQKIFHQTDQDKIIIPLKDDEKYLGFLLFEIFPESQEQFNLEDISFISKQVAFAMKNSILYNLAITDGMTKLYLHRFFQIKLDEAIKKGVQPLSLLLMDIDNFKKVNDTYGHQAGDYVLKTIASLIKGHIRKTDSAFRYGGEEMTVILPETNLENAFEIGDKIRSIIENYNFQYQDLELKITVSVGAAQFRANETKEVFIQRTDEAMYQAKSSGKNKVVISED